MAISGINLISRLETTTLTRFGTFRSPHVINNYILCSMSGIAPKYFKLIQGINKPARLTSPLLYQLRHLTPAQGKMQEVDS